MAYLILPSKRTRQPQGAARIDWSNPLTRGLLGLLVPTVSPGNIVNAADPSVIGAITPSRDGLYSRYYGELSTDSRIISATSLSVYARFLTSSSIGAQECVFGRGPTGSSNNIGFGFHATHNVSAYSGAIYGGGGYSIVGKPTGGALVANTQYSIGFSHDGSNGRCYSDGRLTVGPTAIGSIDTTGRLAINATSTLENDGQCAFSVFGYWNRILSDADYAAIHANPWQLVAPDSRRLWFAPSGGATVITSSGAAALVAKATAAYAATHAASAVARTGLRATAATTSIRTATVAARTTERGTAATTSLRTGIAAGRVSANAATTYSAIVSGTFAAAGRTTARGTAAYASTHNATAAATTAIAGTATTTTLRTGIAAARVDARAAVTAAALVAGTVTTTAAAQIIARASVTNTTERIAAVAAMLALRGANPAAPELPVEIPPSTRSLFPDRSRLGLSPVAPFKPRLG